MNLLCSRGRPNVVRRDREVDITLITKGKREINGNCDRETKMDSMAQIFYKEKKNVDIQEQIDKFRD